MELSIKVNKQLKYYQSNLNIALDTFLKTNKRVDRDRVLSYTSKIEMLKWFIAQLNE